MKRTNLKLKRVLVLLSVFLLWGGGYLQDVVTAPLTTRI